MRQSAREVALPGTGRTGDDDRLVLDDPSACRQASNDRLVELSLAREVDTRDACRLFVRRSHSLGDEVMRTMKQKRRYAIDLPPEAMDVLRWHVATQLKTPEQEESDLLFPPSSAASATARYLPSRSPRSPSSSVSRSTSRNARFVDFQRPRARRAGERPRHPLHLGPSDRPDAASLFLREFGRATRRAREGDPPRPPRWGGWVGEATRSRGEESKTG